MSKAKDKARRKFHKLYHKALAKIDNISLNVLVWGPSPTGSNPVARKRLEIRDALNNLGHNAMFSEDIDSGSRDLSEKTKELRQAKAADLIIALVENSPGALAEVHDFCNEPDIAPKIYVLAPQAYAGGYSAKGAIALLDQAYGGVHWYEEAELVRCNVKSKAVTRVEARKQLQANRKERS